MARWPDLVIHFSKWNIILILFLLSLKVMEMLKSLQESQAKEFDTIVRSVQVCINPMILRA